MSTQLASQQLFIHSKIEDVRYVGPSIAKRFRDRGINSVLDLWNFLPYKYEDTTNILTVRQFYQGWERLPIWLQNNLKQKACVRGIVEQTQRILTRNRRLTIIKAVIRDPYAPSYKIAAIWFNQIHVLHTLKPNTPVVLYGTIERKGSHFEIIAPQFEVFKLPLTHLGRITPIYPQINKITSKMIRRYIYQIRPTISQIQEFVPKDILQEHSLIPIPDAYLNMHFPKDMESIKLGYTRLFIQEMLELLSEKHAESGERPPTLLHEFPELAKKLSNTIQKLERHLPFQLTNDQRKALEEFLKLGRTSAKIFLYGDVGSGKTAIFFLLAAALANMGFSSILMAPTTLLANQHYETFLSLAQRLGEQKPNILLISAKSKQKVIPINSPTIVIGTQAILHREIQTNFPIVLIGADEEHRFGLFQREKLFTPISLNSPPETTSQAKTIVPYLLSLSATPIPRTLALTIYGYQGSIYIKERPFPLRTQTHLVPTEKLEALINWTIQQVKEKNSKVFLVFPRIEGEEDTGRPALLAWQPILEPYFKRAGIKTGILHGKQRETERDKVVREFSAGDIQVLFTTTIIEVGIDIPNADIIIIFGPEFLGLAQLHQLRGRVGRHGNDGYCYLYPLTSSPQILKRLKYFASQTDGLKIAEFDLKNRGPGDILLGSEQHGWRRFKIANLNNFYLVNQSIKIFRQLQDRDIKIKRYINPTQVAAPSHSS